MKHLILILSFLCLHSAGFSHSRPRVWWHWMNGNISKEGIAKDLLWMHESGIGGVTIFDAGMQTSQVVSHRLGYMTPEWKDALSYALTLADSLNMEVTIPSSPGWSLMGGPWVTPQDAMKKLTWRETIITGTGRKQTIALPAPYATTGPFQNTPLTPNLLLGEVLPEHMPEHYEDIRIVAWPMSAGDRSLADFIDWKPSHTLPIHEGKAVLDIRLPQAETFQALTLNAGTLRLEFDAMPAQTIGRLLVKAPNGEWQPVTDILAGGAPLQTISFAPVSGSEWRLELNKPAADPALAMMGYALPEPTEMTIRDFNLFTLPRVNHAEEKAGFMASHDLALYPNTRCTGVSPDEVIDLSDKVDSTGRLTWRAPKGRWKIVRLGWSLTGKRNHPASPEATGLEIDKLSPKVWRNYWEHYLNMYDVKGKEAIKYVLTDSYESGTQT